LTSGTQGFFLAVSALVFHIFDRKRRTVAALYFHEARWRGGPIFMSQTFFEPEVAETKDHEPQASLEAPTLALSAADFSALEERVVRAVALVKREREARVVAEARATRAEAQLGEQSPVVDQLRQEVRSLRAERDQVRQRVERLLSQLDALEL
jgi:hypothetical protein